MHLGNLSWLPQDTAVYIHTVLKNYAALTADELDAEIVALTAANRTIHERDCLNLNPGTNAMNPRAEALLADGLGSRPSLGYPGEKYEMGLEAIEKIEVMAAALACELFGAEYAEIRVASGSMANLYAFMATCQPGDKIIAPPAEIGGHITHHQAGAAGLYGVEIHAAPVDAAHYTVDVAGLRKMAHQLRPRLITVGGSLNLCAHPVRELRQIADEVGAWLLFDAAHLSGMIAGQAWQQPLAEGAHLMTMSTYKSLGGPPSGLIVTNEPELAQRLDAIAYPGLTANFDVSKSAALAMTLLDWRVFGKDYAAMMRDTAVSLATSLAAEGLPVFATAKGFTQSHQFALEAKAFGGGQTAARKLRAGNILACGIGLPIAPVSGDLNGLRFGTPEIVRWGMTPEQMPRVAALVADILLERRPLPTIRQEVTALRSQFQTYHYIR
ncbi:MAG: aminotransferase class I/II-fold pyridoxal phosphate-dependent enzyme [Ardenticatenaceae bacterium]|nr:aminotransferase class I/II-fold pyridoxal phosphate-dependent enzyme [Ardenticatenaceae bacterium]